MTAVVAQNCFELKYATDELEEGREIVMTAVVAQNCFGLNYATDELEEGREIFEVLVSVAIYIFLSYTMVALCH